MKRARERLEGKLFASPLTVPILENARYVIECGWTQHHMAVNASGRPVRGLTSPAVACFCSAGAIIRAAEVHEAKYQSIEAREATNFLRYVTNYSIITEWNDHPRQTKANVLRGFDRAIKLAKEWRKAA